MVHALDCRLRLRLPHSAEPARGRHRGVVVDRVQDRDLVLALKVVQRLARLDEGLHLEALSGSCALSLPLRVDVVVPHEQLELEIALALWLLGFSKLLVHLLLILLVPPCL